MQFRNTHYQQVLEFNEAFEVKVYEGYEEDLFVFQKDDANKKLVMFRFSLIDEEVKELAEAIAQKDFIEVIDALCDILYVTYGMYSVLGIDVEQRLILNLNSADTEVNIMNLLISDTKSYIDHKLIPNANHKELMHITKSLAILALNTENRSDEEVKTNDIFTDMLTVDYRFTNIKKHVDNLEDSINLGNYSDMVHSLDKIVLSTYEATAAFNIDINKAFDIVHDSNMTKLCISETEAQKTVTYYKSIPETSDKYYDSPAYRESKAPGKWIVYNESTSKILKNINYVKVDFAPLFE